MRSLLFLVLSSSVASIAIAAPVRTSAVEKHPGIDYEKWEDTAVPARIHLVRVDLTSAEIALYATKESDRGITSRQLGLQLDAQVVINGDAFAVAGYRPRGLAIGDTAPWTNTADDAASAVFHLRRVGERTVAGISPPEQVLSPELLPEGTQGVISGRPLLLRAGAVEAAFDCNDPVTLACTRAPRSAAAITADGNTLLLVTVDGWQAGSIGLTAAELAAFLRARGGHSAVAFDGGSSATLVLDGAVVNAPSDGIERSVANHLAIKFGALPAGQMVGIICSTDIFTCADDEAFRLPGAEVTLDDGRVRIVGSDAFYNFTGVTPRHACVTVKKAGYKTKTQCQTVESGIQTYNSVALEEGMDPPPNDAGVPDGPPNVTDAGILDDGARPDAGFDVDPPGGGCCDAGDRPSGTMILVVLVAFMALRRRGTTPGR
ncbi:MAG: phosphodiester glycosidase family protein [Deltaproteobacteria bacterium]|nr:phosphodiester glycosidase family protein [Deltaproteobacteria bacterium]